MYVLSYVFMCFAMCLFVIDYPMEFVFYVCICFMYVFMYVLFVTCVRYVFLSLVISLVRYLLCRYPFLLTSFLYLFR